ncbi:hypothetical protein [Streptomyces xanthophaeus]
MPLWFIGPAPGPEAEDPPVIWFDSAMAEFVIQNGPRPATGRPPRAGWTVRLPAAQIVPAIWDAARRRAENGEAGAVPEPARSLPDPVRTYAAGFDDLLTTQQWNAFAHHLSAHLLAPGRPRDARPHARTAWDWETVDERRLALLLSHTSRTPHAAGVLAVGTGRTAAPGSRTGNRTGSTGMASLWCDNETFHPLHHISPDRVHDEHRPDGKPEPENLPQAVLDLTARAVAARVPFRVVSADCFYGVHHSLQRHLASANLPYILNLLPRDERQRGGASRRLRQAVLDQPQGAPGGDVEWTPVTWTGRDGRAEGRWAAETTLPGERATAQPIRLIVVTTDPSTLSEGTTRYLSTNLPRLLACDGTDRDRSHRHDPAAVAHTGPRKASVPHRPHTAASTAEVAFLHDTALWACAGLQQASGDLDPAAAAVATARHHVLRAAALAVGWGELDAPATTAAAVPAPQRSRLAARLAACRHQAPQPSFRPDMFHRPAATHPQG